MIFLRLGILGARKWFSIFCWIFVSHAQACQPSPHWIRSQDSSNSSTSRKDWNIKLKNNIIKNVILIFCIHIDTQEFTQYLLNWGLGHFEFVSKIKYQMKEKTKNPFWVFFIFIFSGITFLAFQFFIIFFVIPSFIVSVKLRKPWD